MPKTGDRIKIVTYRILAGDMIHPVEVINPVEIFPLDQDVALPVYIRCYATKNGGAMYALRMKVSEEADF